MLRVISKDTIDELTKHVPTAQGTILYLQASLWIHEPYRNQSFGPPTSLVQSLWAGITTWRCWRRYVELTKGITLTNNWISRSHYLTLEFMAHAGILYQLALFLSFPELDLDSYSLRSTGNRSIEAVHSILRGGAANLPITSANLSFQEFLSHMNQVMQIKQSEHTLQKIPGNSINSTKKKVIMYATRSNEGTVHNETHSKPKTYSQFITDLKSACAKGDSQSKALIEQHVPQMAKILKKEEQWDRPSLCVTRPANKDLTIVMESSDMRIETDVFDKVIELTLDADQSEFISPSGLADDVSDDFNEAISLM